MSYFDSLLKKRRLEECPLPLWKLKITEEDIIEALDGLPESKVHCSNLGVSALRNAINNYLVVKRMEDSYENSNSGR